MTAPTAGYTDWIIKLAEHSSSVPLAQIRNFSPSQPAIFPSFFSRHSERYSILPSCGLDSLSPPLPSLYCFSFSFSPTASVPPSLLRQKHSLRLFLPSLFPYILLSTIRVSCFCTAFSSSWWPFRSSPLSPAIFCSLSHMQQYFLAPPLLKSVPKT